MILCRPDSLQEKEKHQAEGGEEQESWRTVEDDEDKRFWEEPTPYTPESRLETHRYIEEKRRAKENVRYGFILIYSMNWKKGNFQRYRKEEGDCLTLNVIEN